MIAITGHASLIFAQLLKRPPISLRRELAYPMPFIGLSILSVMLVTEVDSSLSENTATWIRYLGWALLLTPGPVYIHLSWAPRWRLLCRLEEGLDPFEGELPARPNSEMLEGIEDSDMELAIEDIEDDPPLLHVEDCEE